MFEISLLRNIRKKALRRELLLLKLRKLLQGVGQVNPRYNQDSELQARDQEQVLGPEPSLGLHGCEIIFGSESRCNWRNDLIHLRGCSHWQICADIFWSIPEEALGSCWQQTRAMVRLLDQRLLGSSQIRWREPQSISLHICDSNCDQNSQDVIGIYLVKVFARA